MYGGSPAVVNSLFVVATIVCGFNVCSLFCFAVFCVVISFAIIWLGKREPVALLLLCPKCDCSILWSYSLTFRHISLET